MLHPKSLKNSGISKIFSSMIRVKPIAKKNEFHVVKVGAAGHI